ncbi:NAD(P)/FAD-dependent oxidoreductase [Candidatus Poribacteria bacterium]
MSQLGNGKTHFDVAVIGGGPAGLLAAGRAAELGAKVILVEKNRRLGRKLLITGNRRCNITQAIFNAREFVENFGENGRFLFSSLAVFGVEETIDFFQSRGLETKIERGGRVFPASDKAEDVLNILTDYATENGVVIEYDSKVTDIEKQDNRIANLVLQKGKMAADCYIFCTGGKSFPGTGSTGDGFGWSEKLGHSVTELSPALVPIKIEEKWVADLQGLGLKNVEMNIFQHGKKQDSDFGELLFTHFGVSGPIVLHKSKKVGQLLRQGEVKLSLDLKPALDFTKLDRRLQRDFEKYHNRAFKNCLDDLLPRKLIPVIVELSGIEPFKQVNNITKEERRALGRLLKGLEMTVSGLLGFGQALITSGGIAIKEIDPKTMRSKLIDNLFFAGEIIDLDGPTGGYNLQVCWSTGYVAGESAAYYS